MSEVKKRLDAVTIDQITQQPLLKDDGKGALCSIATLAITNNSGGSLTDARIRTSVAGRPPHEYLLTVTQGTQLYEDVEVVDLDQDCADVTFELLASDGSLLAKKIQSLKQARRWRLFVVHNSHVDIGYTDPQQHLSRCRWPAILEHASKEIEHSSDWPRDSRYRYVMEASYMFLGGAWQHKDADWIEAKVRDHLRTGRLAYSASVFNQVNEMMSGEELARFYYYSKRFMRDILGVGPDLAAYHTDDPGFSWGQVGAAVEAGIHYYELRLNGGFSDWQTDKYPRVYRIKGRDPSSRILVWDAKDWYFPIGDWTEYLDFSSSKLTIDDVAQGLAILEQHDEFGKGGSGSGPPYPYDTFLVDFTYCGEFAGNPDGYSDYYDPFHAARPDNNATWAGRPPAEPGDPPAGVKDKVKELNGQGYAYPKLIYATPGEFLRQLEATCGDSIPEYSGTREDYWNVGAASAAYETAINRRNHDRVPAAELLSTVACVLDPGRAYPHEQLSRAYLNMLLYDEHTWAADDPNRSPVGQDPNWLWKRNCAVNSSVLGEKLLGDARADIAGSITSTGDRTVVVFNSSSWDRNDLVEVPLAGWPSPFQIVDVGTGHALPYQKNSTVATFVADQVPALGYRCYRVEPAEADPPPDPSLKQSADSIENDFFKVTFDRETGHITHITDKLHGNRELVDDKAPYGMNECLFYATSVAGEASRRSDDPGPQNKGVYCCDTDSPYRAKEAALAVGAPGAVSVSATATNKGRVKGIDGLERKVVLYSTIPRIDIVNTVLKSLAATKKCRKLGSGEVLHRPGACTDEELFFAFPFKVTEPPDEPFEIRHEMPAGDVRPGVKRDITDPDSEQLLSSCTAHYTVNRWVHLSDRKDYGITFCPTDAPLVQYGERRSNVWTRPPSPDHPKESSYLYNTAHPWLYSYAMNNKWWTNFPVSQRGLVTLRYSIGTHDGATWQRGEAQRLGGGVAAPLTAQVVTGPGQGALPAAQGRFLSIDRDHVVLTTAKSAEANGEGLILRFNEVHGVAADVEVDLGLFGPAAVAATDLVENDDCALSARATASSELEVRPDFEKTGIVGPCGPDRAIDGITDGDHPTEWRSSGEAKPTIRLQWHRPRFIERIVVHDLKSENSWTKAWTKAGTLTFSDGTRTEITGIPKGGTGEASHAGWYTWVEFKITDSEGSSPGLCAIEAPAAPMEVEESKVRFHIGAYGWETLRLTRGDAPAAPASCSVETTGQGTMVSWDPVPDAAYYEVFRSKDPGFAAGTGSYLGATTRTGKFVGRPGSPATERCVFWDRQVTTDLSSVYFYKVRAVAAGRKSEETLANGENPPTLTDTLLTAPGKLTGERLYQDKVALSWEPSTDAKGIAGYVISRDTGPIVCVCPAQTDTECPKDAEGGNLQDSDLTCYLDDPTEECTYTVRAKNLDGKLSDRVRVKVEAFQGMGER